jgi:capsule polysaccharide export protein KpsE/RkpR
MSSKESKEKSDMKLRKSNIKKLVGLCCVMVIVIVYFEMFA